MKPGGGATYRARAAASAFRFARAAATLMDARGTWVGLLDVEDIVGADPIGDGVLRTHLPIVGSRTVYRLCGFTISDGGGVGGGMGVGGRGRGGGGGG